MTQDRKYSGWLLILTLAALGAGMIFIPREVVSQYEKVKSFGTFWVYAYFSLVGIGAALLFGVTARVLWSLYGASLAKRAKRERRSRDPSALSQIEQTKELDENLSSVAKLHEDTQLSSDVKSRLEALAQRLEEKRENHRLEIVAFGSISSGKSSLLNSILGKDLFSTDLRGGTTTTRQEAPWPGMEGVTLVDTPGLDEIDGAEHIAVAATSAKDADVVLVVVDGPLRDSEYRLIERLAKMEKPLIVCLNKEDWYSSRDREELMGQLQRQLGAFVQKEGIVAVRSQTTKRKRIRVATSGEEVHEDVDVPPDITPLAERMRSVVQREGPAFLLANLLTQSRGLVEEAKAQVSQDIDRRARKTVEKYMWAAGGAAALSPLPVLDLLAGSAITSKMVVDLARIYRQPVDLEMATTLLGQLGKNLLAILGVSAVTPAITALTASVVKTVPGVGTLAGGLLQGVVQALITRWIGAIFVEYFKNEMHEPEGGLTGLARREWQKVTTVNELRKLVQDARTFLQGKSE